MGAVLFFGLLIFAALVLAIIAGFKGQRNEARIRPILARIEKEKELDFELLSSWVQIVIESRHSEAGPISLAYEVMTKALRRFALDPSEEGKSEVIQLMNRLGKKLSQRGVAETIRHIVVDSDGLLLNGESLEKTEEAWAEARTLAKKLAELDSLPI